MKNLKLRDPEKKPHFQLMDLVKAVNLRVKNMRFEYSGGDRVECYVGWERVGELGYAYHSRAGSDLFHVRSDYIQNYKSPRHTKLSKHIREVVKECVRVFKNTESSKIAENIVSKCRGKCKSIFEAHKFELQYDKWIPKIYNNSHVFGLRLIESCVEGEPLPEPDNLDDDIKSIMKDKLHAYEVVEELWSDFEKDLGYCIRVEKDGTYNVVDLTEPTCLLASTQDFDELPEIIKDKITLLKVQSSEACMVNTGIKTQNNLFYISKADMDHLV
tara:strand:- start:335 stop:1150 length:816 start_codon:yes stop_codon:yes gene_type:complete